jgi:hypothetical protein
MRIVIDGTKAGADTRCRNRGGNVKLVAMTEGAGRQKRLMRLGVRQAGCARDDFAGACSESSEIDGRDLAALLEERGYRLLGVRIGPPFLPVPFLFFVLSRHGNTKMSPPCLLSNKDGRRQFPNGCGAFAVPNHIHQLVNGLRGQARVKNA